MSIAEILPRSGEGFDVMNAVCNERGLSWTHVVSRSRQHVLVDARREIARRLMALNWTTPQIGRLLRRDHSSIVQLTANPKRRKHRREAQRVRYYLNTGRAA